jgi:hypothetical protein
MCTKTEYIKKLRGPWPKSGIDNWIRNQVTIEPRFQLKGNLKGLHTDGVNKISHDRKQYYSNSKNSFILPFYPPEQNLEEILPKDLILKLKKIK